MQAAIDVERVSKRFVRPLPRLSRVLGGRGPEAVDALRDVSLQIESGETFGLVGRNGQGKTTLIKTVCGLIEPSSGHVRVFGHDSVRAAREVKRRVGLVSADERSFYFRLTGFENLLFFARLWGLASGVIGPRIEALAETFELTPVLARPFQEYSAGNKQRLAIARALLPDPPLLLLDEPTRSLDPISAEGLRRTLAGWAGAGAGKTVLITTHNLAEIEALCARVAVLSRGRVIECASLASLREKYAREERIELGLRGAPSERFFVDLRGQLGAVEHVPGTDGRFSLRFSRRAEDERLQQALALCLRDGLQVLACDTVRSGLRHVLEAVEARESARERNEVEARPDKEAQ